MYKQYVYKELQNPQSDREGVVLFADSLTSAKRQASRAQFYRGTVLKLFTPGGTLVSTKSQAGNWVDHETTE